MNTLIVLLALCHPNILPRENAPVESTIDGFVEHNIFILNTGASVEQLLVWQWDNINARHYIIYFYARHSNFSVVKKEGGIILVFYDSLIRRERRIYARYIIYRTLFYDIEMLNREIVKKDDRPPLSLTEKSKSDWRYPPQPPKEEHFFGFAKYEYIHSR